MDYKCGKYTKSMLLKRSVFGQRLIAVQLLLKSTCGSNYKIAHCALEGGLIQALSWSFEHRIILLKCPYLCYISFLTITLIKGFF